MEKKEKNEIIQLLEIFVLICLVEIKIHVFIILLLNYKKNLFLQFRVLVL